MADVVRLRQGDNLALTATATTSGGTVRDLTDVAATLELAHKDSGYRLSLENANSSVATKLKAGEMLFTETSSETLSWPVDRWDAWFRFQTAAGVVDTTDNFLFWIVEDYK